MRAHAQEKPFSCTHAGCTRSFTRRPDLLQHLRLHGGPGDFVCECHDGTESRIGCGAKFHCKRDLERHRRRAGGAKCRPRKHVEGVSDGLKTQSNKINLESAIILSSVAISIPSFESSEGQSVEILPVDCPDSPADTASVNGCFLASKNTLCIKYDEHFALQRFTCPVIPKDDDTARMRCYTHGISFLWRCRLEHGWCPSVSFVTDAIELLSQPREQSVLQEALRMQTVARSEKSRRLQVHLLDNHSGFMHSG